MIINTVKYIANIETPTTYTGYIVNDIRSTDIGSGDRYELAVKKWMKETYEVGSPASNDYSPLVGYPASDDYDPAVPNSPEMPYTAEYITSYTLNKIEVESITLISNTIQNEVMTYNRANGIALANVHNAESYSRVDGYTHQAFCLQVWLWSVELWEFMRAWQTTLTGIPSTEQVQTKINELPFVLV